VLRVACQQGRRWQDAGIDKGPLFADRNVSSRSPLSSDETGTSAERAHAYALRMNVNVAAGQLKKQGDFVREVAQILRETGLQPHRLVLEITESVAMDEAEQTIETLRELKTLGVQLAIDDFGTGYSSLSYLRSFPLDILKIDRRFVTGLKETPGDKVIVESMIDLAHALI